MSFKDDKFCQRRFSHDNHRLKLFTAGQVMGDLLNSLGDLFVTRLPYFFGTIHDQPGPAAKTNPIGQIEVEQSCPIARFKIAGTPWNS